MVKLEKESQELDGKLQTVLDEIENLANGATEVREQYKLVEEVRKEAQRDNNLLGDSLRLGVTWNFTVCGGFSQMLRQKEEEVEALNEAFNKLKKKAKKAKTVELTIAQEVG